VEKTNLGDRMKGYEAVSQGVLMKRTPVILRLDGRSFHTFTKRFKEFDESLDKTPFSKAMYNCMVGTAITLVHQIQGARFAYAQSDEISILMTDWDTFTTQQWFGGKIQKIVSIAAATASAAFYKCYEAYEPIEYMPHRPLFDARVFNLPREEVANYFVWRQKDAMRNSVNMLGQYHFSHRELQGKKVDEVKDMLHEKYNVDWLSLPTWMKQGFCVQASHTVSSRGPSLDEDGCPDFIYDREYIEKWLGDDYPE